MLKPLNPKVRKVITAVVVIAILVLVGYGVYVAISRSNIPVFDNGHELSTIKLVGSESGTNEWYFTIDDTTVAEIVDKTSSIERENEMDDSGIPVMYYVVKGKKGGKTKITFRYGSFASGETLEKHTYLIEVNEKLETRITEQ